MKIRKLDVTNKRDVRQFIDFQFELYRDCPQWVPLLRSSSAETMNPKKHPFYEHSIADFYVVESEGQTVGRMAMLHNRNYAAFKKRNASFFGYFDVIEDQEVAYNLFDLAVEWTQKHGLTEIIGPRGVMGVDGMVLVEGFEHRASLGMTYNYPYYDTFIKKAGFSKDADYLSGYWPFSPGMSERYHQLARKVGERRNIQLKSFSSKKELKAWADRLIDTHHHAFGDLHSYYPPTDAEMEMVLDTIMQITDHRLIKLVMRDDEIIGFLFSYHDISEGLQKAKGRLFPFGWYHILRERSRTKWINVNSIGLLPEHRGSGGSTILQSSIEATAQEMGFEHAEFIQIHEENARSIIDLEKYGVDWYKRHRHYRRLL